MPTVNSIRPAAGTATSGLFIKLHRAVIAVGNWNDARITRKALSGLTARELDDIGLTAGDIKKISARKLR